MDEFDYIMFGHVPDTAGAVEDEESTANDSKKDEDVEVVVVKDNFPNGHRSPHTVLDDAEDDTANLSPPEDSEMPVDKPEVAEDMEDKTENDLSEQERHESNSESCSSKINKEEFSHRVKKRKHKLSEIGKSASETNAFSSGDSDSEASKSSLSKKFESIVKDLKISGNSEDSESDLESDCKKNSGVDKSEKTDNNRLETSSPSNCETDESKPSSPRYESKEEGTDITQLPDSNIGNSEIPDSDKSDTENSKMHCSDLDKRKGSKISIKTNGYKEEPSVLKTDKSISSDDSDLNSASVPKGEKIAKSADENEEFSGFNSKLKKTLDKTDLVSETENESKDKKRRARNVQSQSGSSKNTDSKGKKRSSSRLETKVKLTHSDSSDSEYELKQQARNGKSQSGSSKTAGSKGKKRLNSRLKTKAKLTHSDSSDSEYESKQKFNKKRPGKKLLKPESPRSYDDSFLEQECEKQLALNSSVRVVLHRLDLEHIETTVVKNQPGPQSRSKIKARNLKEDTDEIKKERSKKRSRSSSSSDSDTNFNKEKSSKRQGQMDVHDTGSSHKTGRKEKGSVSKSDVKVRFNINNSAADKTAGSDSSLSDEDLSKPSTSKNKRTSGLKQSDDQDPVIIRTKKLLKCANLRIQNYSELWKGCKTVEQKKNRMVQFMKDKGLIGAPTFKNCKKLAKKLEKQKEILALDRRNIIDNPANSGRLTRSKAPSTVEQYGTIPNTYSKYKKRSYSLNKMPSSASSESEDERILFATNTQILKGIRYLTFQMQCESVNTRILENVQYNANSFK